MKKTSRDVTREAIESEIQSQNAKNVTRQLTALEEPIRDQLEKVFILVWHWNSYDVLENYSRVHPSGFVPPKTNVDEIFLQDAASLNALFWNIAEVEVLYHDLENWPYDSDDEPFEFSDLDYYEDFEFNFDISAIGELFELGCLYGRVEVQLKAEYGDDYIADYIEAMELELHKRNAKDHKFQSGGAKGGKRKGGRAYNSVKEYIRRNISIDSGYPKTKELANEIHKNTKSLSIILKQYGPNAEEYTSQEHFYLAGLIHPLFLKDDRPSDSNKKGQVYSFDRIEKLIVKAKREVTLSKMTETKS